MDYHQNARTMMWSREKMARMVVEQGFTLKLAAAASFNVSAKTAAKWVRRYRLHGVAGLADRSSRPRRLRCPTPPELIARVEVLRRERWTGFRIARATGLLLYGLQIATLNLDHHNQEKQKKQQTEERPAAATEEQPATNNHQPSANNEQPYPDASFHEDVFTTRQPSAASAAKPWPRSSKPSPGTTT